MLELAASSDLAVRVRMRDMLELCTAMDVLEDMLELSVLWMY